MSDETGNTADTEAQEVEESTESPEQPDAVEGDELEEIDEDVAWDSKRALSKIRKLNGEIRAAKEKISAAQEKAAASDEKDSTISQLQQELLRERVGRKLSLPDELIDRLKGSSEEELLADAEKLVGMFTSLNKTARTKPVEVGRGGTNPETEIEETDPLKLAKAAMQRGGW